MKFFTRVSLTTYISMSPLLILHQMADANVDQAYGITIVQVVFGLYLGNHYRGRIRNAFKKFFPRSGG